MQSGNRLLFTVLIIAIICSTIFAQEIPPVTDNTTGKTAVLTPPQESDNKDELPPPAQGYKRLTFKAKRILINGSEKSIRYLGAVSVEADNFKMTADEVIYSDKNGMIYATGNITLNSKDGNNYSGNTAQVDVHTKAWKFTDWKAEIGRAHV